MKAQIKVNVSELMDQLNDNTIGNEIVYFEAPNGTRYPIIDFIDNGDGTICLVSE